MGNGDDNDASCESECVLNYKVCGWVGWLVVWKDENSLHNNKPHYPQLMLHMEQNKIKRNKQTPFVE